MRRRQAIAILALVGFFIALYLWLYKIGVAGELKCGTGGCETVQTSPWAMVLGLPVAFYGVVGYAVLLVVALVGLRPAWVGRRGSALVLAGLATAGFAFTLWLTYLEVFVIHAICRWCVASAVVMTAIWVVAVSGLRRKDGMTEAG
jgi:uncharacterized membrane protein